MMSAASAIIPTGEVTAAIISPFHGLVPVAGVWPTCRIVIAIRGAVIRSATIPAMVCHIIIQDTTENTSMSVLAAIGPVGIVTAAIIGTAATRTIGTEPMLSVNRIRM